MEFALASYDDSGAVCWRGWE